MGEVVGGVLIEYQSEGSVGGKWSEWSKWAKCSNNGWLSK